MKISFKLFKSLVEFINKVPFRTPHRFALILEFAQQLWSKCSVENDIVDVFDEENDVLFTPNDSMVSKIIEHAHFYSKEELKIVDYDVVLVPTSNYCCQKLIKIDGRHYSTVTLYTEDGVKFARSFRGYCKCGKVYHHGFMEDKKAEMRTYDEEWNYFMVSSVIGFARKVLAAGDF